MAFITERIIRTAAIALPQIKISLGAFQKATVRRDNTGTGICKKTNSIILPGFCFLTLDTSAFSKKY
ncbi:MAG: hypothetical protein ACI4QV_01805 [Acutalibacteraceae bacterium]